MAPAPYQKFAELYDAVMSQDQFYSSYYSFVVELAEKFRLKPKRILEIGCGTGKLSELFLKHGCSVEGLDLSEPMLTIAKKRGVKVHYGGMAGFKLNRKFDVILSIFDSINYLQKKLELEKCFGAVFQHLAAGGLFIFDLNSAFKINTAIPKLFKKEAHYRFGDTELLWRNSHEPDTWIVDIGIKQDGKTFHERHVEKAYKIEDVRKLLKESGFAVAGVYSDFDFSAVRKNSWKWFFVCRKRR